MLREKLPVVSFQHVRISAVLEIKFSADELVLALLRVSESEPVYILDSCGVGHLGSHLLIAGLRPVEVFEVTSDDSDETLALLDENLTKGLAAIFTLSYDLGMKLPPFVTTTQHADLAEPDLFLALFDSLLVHDYDSGRTFFVGNNEAAFSEIV
ncbi:MAG: hypothetical protein ABJB34_13285, partial [Acidobacteriota bacterium]